MGRYWGAGGSLGAVIMGCVVYGIQLGWGAWFSIFDVFWVLFGVVVLSGGFLASGCHCVCVCVCVCVAWSI